MDFGYGRTTPPPGPMGVLKWIERWKGLPFADRVDPVKKIIQVVIAAMPLPPEDEEVHIISFAHQLGGRDGRNGEGGVSISGAVTCTPR